MNTSTEQVEPQATDTSDLGFALLEATIGLKYAANSLSALSRHKERAQKPAAFRRGLSRSEAADYIGVSSTKFGQLVQDNRMPLPMKIDGRSVWDVFALDVFFDQLSAVPESMSSDNPWN